MHPRPGPADDGVREWLVDLLLAVALATLAVSSVFLPDPATAYDFPPPDALLVAVILAGSLPLALRRRLPGTVLALSLAANTVVTLSGWNNGLLPVCLLFALYAVASWQRLRVAVAGLLAVLAMMTAAAVLRVPYFDSALAVLGFAWFVVVWGVGLSMRRLRHRQRTAVDRALEAERTRTAEAERAVFAERLRIARELHDIVAHTLSVIAVQSGVARHLLGAGAGPVGPALTSIEEASRTALDDLRRMLGVLRADPADGGPSRVPSPGLAELRLLASAHRAAYGPVELVVEPAVEEMPESLRLTTYRLVQEALTNVRKHAPGAAAEVSVLLGDGGVVVQVDNDGTAGPAGPAGPAGAPAPDGYGLAGMRERAALFGGTVTAGPRAGGGYRVRAVLPEATPGAEPGPADLAGPTGTVRPTRPADGVRPAAARVPR